MKRVFIIVLFIISVFSSAETAFAQYNDCTCVGTTCSDPVPGLGKDCSTGSVLTCGTNNCSIDYQPVEQLCGGVWCGYKCTYSSSCRGPNDCSCSGQGNCSDPVPNSGMNCVVGKSLSCGSSGCSSSYKPIQQLCTDGSRTQDCGYKCIFDQNCSTGYCQSNPNATPAPITCANFDGDFLCGPGCGGGGSD